jgi:hypothetical protein
MPLPSVAPENELNAARFFPNITLTSPTNPINLEFHPEELSKSCPDSKKERRHMRFLRALCRVAHLGKRVERKHAPAGLLLWLEVNPMQHEDDVCKEILLQHKHCALS